MVNKIKKAGVTKITPLPRIKEVYHEEVIVEPARRLLDALLSKSLPSISFRKKSL